MTGSFGGVVAVVIVVFVAGVAEAELYDTGIVEAATDQVAVGVVVVLAQSTGAQPELVEAYATRPFGLFDVLCGLKCGIVGVKVAAGQVVFGLFDAGMLYR